MRRSFLIAAVAVGVAVAASSAHADEQRARGLRLASEGRCAAALPELDAARQRGPEDADLALRAGQCRLRLQRYADAVTDLERARALAPSSTAAALALAKAHFHAGDPAAADAILSATPALARDAEATLYRGLIAMGNGELETAVTRLESAIALDADRVEPVASFHLGKALARLRRTESASVALERVSDTFAGTDWSTEANRELERVRSGGKRQAWLRVGAGFEHDSNVILRGRGTGLPSDISDEDDRRAVWTANTGLELYKSDRVTAGIMASYRGTTHVELEDFNAHFPSVSLWAETALAESTLARARYDFGYAWFNGDPFVSTNNWQLSLLQGWLAGTTELFVGAQVDDYFADSANVPDACVVGVITFCGPPGLDERRERDRDGWGTSVGLLHTVPVPTGDVPIDDLAVQAGYRYGHTESQGREYRYDSHRVAAGVSAGLPLELFLDVGGAYAYLPYKHASTFPDPSDVTSGANYVLDTVRRHDSIWQIETNLSRAIGDQVSIAAHWRFTDQSSNADVFDYDQHVVGVTVTVAMGREL